MERGFHKAGDVENRLGYHVGQLASSFLSGCFSKPPIYSTQSLLDGVERFAPPRISLYDVGLRPVPRPSKVWNAAMGCLRRLWRKTNSSR